ncbi:hypothetical protein PO124_20275 [Bacillus licheniformis]|nr:hypothetical protein [Bacillus licheniformis]
MTVYLAGDSTVADCPRMKRRWPAGADASAVFSDEAAVVNMAKAGPVRTASLMKAGSMTLRSGLRLVIMC